MIVNEAIQDSPKITDDEGTFCGINQEIQNDRIRRIIQYQKSLYYSSSSSSAASCSSSSSYSRRSSLLDLMKGGNTSPRRLFDMEHTCLSTHFNDYNGSPVIKPIYLWRSDGDEGALSPWSTTIKRLKPPEGSSELDDLIGFASDDISTNNNSVFAEKKSRNKQPLSQIFPSPENPAMEKWVAAKLRQRSGETYVVHLWNRQSKSLRIEQGSILERRWRRRKEELERA